MDSMAPIREVGGLKAHFVSRVATIGPEYCTTSTCVETQGIILCGNTSKVHNSDCSTELQWGSTVCTHHRREKEERALEQNW